MHYFKRYWNEATGDKLTNEWGKSFFYFETDSQFNVLRQIQFFDNGKALKYNSEYIDDKFGGLAEVSLDFEDFKEFRIDKIEFNKTWKSIKYKKIPEIVITKDILWGQPRIDGRRLAVVDIVSSIDINEDLNCTLEDYKLSLQEIRQALHYCKLQQCIEDNPIKFCHNCTLRAKQDKEEVSDECENWKRAKLLIEKHFK